MKKLLPYLKPFMGIYFLSMFIKALGAFTDIAIPFFMGKVIDEGIKKNDHRNIAIMCGCMLIFAILTMTFNILSNYFSSRSTQAMGENMRNGLFGHIQKLTIRSIDKMTTASLITRVTNDIEKIQNSLLMMTRVAVRSPMMCIGGLALTLLIDPVLAGIIFIGMVVIGCNSIYLFTHTHPLFRKSQRSLDKLTLILRESLSGVRQIKGFNKEVYETDRFTNQAKEVKHYEQHAASLNVFATSTVNLMTGVATAAVLLASTWRMRVSNLSIGQIVTVINYITQILMAMNNVPRIFMLFSRAGASSARLNEVLDLKDYTAYGTRDTDKHEDRLLAFSDVTFKYNPTEAPVLSHIDFDIRRGETVGVIGGTGAGKSTLLNLILRHYEPTQGTIKFNNRPIAEYSKDYLRTKVTAALQQYHIFALTIGKNITLNMKSSQDEIDKASETAQLDDVIEHIEDGYGYVIAQTGNNVSGGQKQRINIARTLYRRADLTILDDVSSALDYRTDLKLRGALKQEFKGRSVLWISQRVSSVKDSNRILVLKDGTVAGFDSHERLLKSCSEYQDICRAQGYDIPVSAERRQHQYA